MLRTQVGSVEIAALIDTSFAFPVHNVYPNVPDASQRFAGLLTDQGALPMICACFLLRAGGRTILVDTGYAEAGQAQLLSEIAAAGSQPDEVDTVVFTHLHPDHTAWNIDRNTGRPTFARARYLVPQADWDHFRAQGSDNFQRDLAPLATADQLDYFTGEHSLSPFLTTVPTPGHTPGHTSLVISSGGAHGFILGDVLLSPLDVLDTTLENGFDVDGAQARVTRQTVLTRLEESGEIVASSHLAPGLGRIATTDDGRAWQPLS